MIIMTRCPEDDSLLAVSYEQWVVLEVGLPLCFAEDEWTWLAPRCPCGQCLPVITVLGTFIIGADGDPGLFLDHPTLAEWRGE